MQASAGKFSKYQVNERMSSLMAASRVLRRAVMIQCSLFSDDSGGTNVGGNSVYVVWALRGSEWVCREHPRVLLPARIPAPCSLRMSLRSYLHAPPSRLLPVGVSSGSALRASQPPRKPRKPGSSEGETARNPPYCSSS